MILAQDDNFLIRRERCVITRGCGPDLPKCVIARAGSGRAYSMTLSDKASGLKGGPRWSLSHCVLSLDKRLASTLAHKVTHYEARFFGYGGRSLGLVVTFSP